MSKRILRFPILAVIGLWFGCSSPQTNAEEEVVKTAPVEKPPECFQGCMLSSSGECTTEGNVMDWSGSATETIGCDPRCCQLGAVTGGGEDPDGDGIFADADQCPDKAEDRDGFQDKDGCPDPDNDGDGILDDADLCPLDAEDIDGFQDEDGCFDP